MNKKFIVTGLCLVSLICGIKDVYPLESKKKTGDKKEERIIIAHKDIFGALERPHVIFNHGKHTEALKNEGCETCHPLNQEYNLTFECPFKMVSKDRTSVMNSYHEKCINCHKQRTAEGKKAGPVTCGDCHVKEQESLVIKYPVMEFDFHYHDKHVKKLKKDCGLCHHTYDKALEELIYQEGTELSCYYCHNEQNKRGPSLAVETGLTLKKNLTIRKVSHQLCLNCHVEYSNQDLKAGPLDCSRCHTGKYKTVAELAKTIRPDCKQPDKPLINIKNSRMKAVLLDHKLHETNIKTCRVCHHEKLDSCKKCHDLTGKPEGRGINISSAYHDNSSEKSCIGCHKIIKTEKGCAGCHSHLPEMDLHTASPKKAACLVCHSDKKEGATPVPPITVSELSAEKFPEKVKIRILEKDYEPAVFPHLKIIKRLVKISNESKMATKFHRNLQTLCEGCHHNRHLEAEAAKNTPPFCRNCHSVSFDAGNMNKPRLLAAYHQRCTGCHEKMKLKPMECKDCHKEKTKKAGG